LRNKKTKFFYPKPSGLGFFFGWRSLFAVRKVNASFTVQKLVTIFNTFLIHNAGWRASCDQQNLHASLQGTICELN
jgi:hypothetical protein